MNDIPVPALFEIITASPVNELNPVPPCATATSVAAHVPVPIVKKLMMSTMRKSSDKGFLSTIEGRRCRFDQWEPERRFIS